MEKEAIRTFLEHKSEENAKELIFHAGTVFDSVKRKYLTASRVSTNMKASQVERQELKV